MVLSSDDGLFTLVIDYRSFWVSPVIIDDLAIPLILIILAGLLYKFRQWIRVIPPKLFSDAAKRIGFGRLTSLFFSELGDRVLAQKDVITDSRVRRATHMIVFWGFVGLLFATTWDDIFYHDGAPPELFNLGKMVGNIGGILVFVGVTVMLFRSRFAEKYSKGRKGDVAFIAILYIATISGFGTELLRVNSLGTLPAYVTYALHLILVTTLLATAPFTHFFHAALEPFMRYVGRVHKSVLTKNVIDYSDYRKLAMVENVELVGEGRIAATFPSWLKREEAK